MTSTSRIEDLEAEVPLTNLSRRAKLDKTFKPIFEKHEETGGIPLNLLHAQLEKYQVEKDLPPGGLATLLKKADEDHDGVLDYDEFILLVTETAPDMIKPKHLSRFNRALRGAISSVVPFKLVDDYMEHYNCKPPPLFMILISFIEVVVFVYYYTDLKDTDQPVTANSGVPLYGPFIYNPSRRYEVWRYVTYMLIHRGYIHIISNLIFQLLIGLPLELVHKWHRLGTVYILGVIAGSLASSVTDPKTILCGASGGCYALIGAHFAIVIMNWKEMTHNWHKGVVKTMCSAPMRLMLWTLFASFDIGMAVYNRYSSDHNAGVSYAAHLGGAVAGLLVGIPVLKNFDVKRWEKIVFWISLAVYVLGVSVAIGFNLISANYPKTDWRTCCPTASYR